MGLAPAVVDTLQGARAPSTQKAYTYRWEVFRSWCNARRLDPLACGAGDVLLFLQDLLEAGRSPSTLRGMVAAIKAARVGPRKLSEDDCGLLTRFLRGAGRGRPSLGRPVAPPWDLELVLTALRHDPFEPLETVGLQWLSFKTAFLLAIVSAKRIGELHALSVHEGCCRSLPDNAGVELRPNPAFHPKVWESRTSQSFVLRPFNPPQRGDVVVGGQSLLCPVRALRAYIRRTQAERTTDQLFVCYRPNCRGQPVSKARLSHWVVETIQEAYKQAGRPAPARVRAHSTRGLSTSWALWRGATLSEVCAAASWSAPSTFTRFYCLNVAASTPFAERVLGSAQ